MKNSHFFDITYKFVENNATALKR